MNAIIVKDLSKHFSLSKRGRKGMKGGMKGSMQGGMKGMKGSMQGGMKGMKGQLSRSGKIRAVDNISFEVKKGEIFGYLGPNGAGKTTTIRMLTGVLKPTQGNITIFGENIWKHQIKVKQVMGHVPEEANVYMDLTGLQNLTFIGELYGIPKKVRIMRAESLLKKFEIFGPRHLKAKKYSKGMKQRLLLCMALMSTPKILFLDEPTQGLDVQSSIIIKKLLKEYNKNGMTIFMTTHDMEVANELCDRIAIINKGKLIGLDTPENLRKLKQEYQAIDFYFTQDVNQEEIEKLSSVKEVKKIGECYHVIVHDINNGIHELMDYLKSNNIMIKKLNTYEPRLEEVFIKMIK